MNRGTTSPIHKSYVESGSAARRTYCYSQECSKNMLQHTQTNTDWAQLVLCVCWGRAKESHMKREGCIYWQAGRRQQPITQSVCRPCIQSTLYCGDTNTTHLHINIYIHTHIYMYTAYTFTSIAYPSLCSGLSLCGQTLGQGWGLTPGANEKCIWYSGKNETRWWHFPKFPEMPTKEYVTSGRKRALHPIGIIFLNLDCLGCK